MKADRTIRIITEPLQKQWDAAVHHPLQSWAWGEFRQAMGIDIVRIGMLEKDRIKEGLQISFHRIPHTPWTIGYAPKGPDVSAVMRDELLRVGKQKNAIFIQLEPNVTAESMAVKPAPGLIPSHHPLFTKYTFSLDMAKGESELLAAMHPKTRYNIRIAQKRGVVISEDDSDAAFQAYLSLEEETTRRQGFYAHNRTYHTTMWRIMHDAGIAKLFTATYENTVVAAWILFVWGQVLYYPYGASSRTNREVMAPNLLLWDIVRWAKRHNLTSFDLWGALGPNPDEHDPWYGFHRFKEGYRPNLVEFAGSFDLVVQPIPYRLYCAADTIRWQLLRLKSRI